MTFKFKLFAATFVCFAVVGCASGPNLSSIKESIATQEPGKARIYFYRASHFGGAYQPDVTVNGEKVGTAQIQGVFLKDYAPGTYIVSTSMAQGKDVSLSLLAGDVKYVRLAYRIGFNIYPELVDTATGTEETASLSYTGMLSNTKR